MRCQSHSSTVFSLPITVKVKRDSSILATYQAGEIIALSYSAISPDIGFSGIMTTSVNVTLANKTSGSPACQKGDIISIEGDGTFQNFYVQDREYDKYTTTLTAYDSCSKLETGFDNSSFDEYSTDQQGVKSIKLYTQTQVITAMSTQLGLSISAPTDIGIKFAKSDLTGSCRDILEAISEINGCMWVCSASNQIMAVMYKDYASTAVVSSYDEVLADTSSVAFNGLVVTDTTLNEERQYGSDNIFRYISSGLIKGNSNVGGALYTRFQSATYSSFKMTNAQVSSVFSPSMPQQIMYNSGTTAIALCMDAVYTAAGWLIQYSSPEADPDVATYQLKDKRMLKYKDVNYGAHGNMFTYYDSFGVAINKPISS